MTMYELMVVYKVDEKCFHHFGEDFTASEIKHEDNISVDSEPCCIGRPREIVDYLLKNEMKDYKLVKKKKKSP